MSSQMSSNTEPDAPDTSVDNQFRSLMEGLRTTLPGAQVLVAFLLVLPVQADFDALSDVELISYYIAFAAALAASVLLIAPSAHQRVRSPISGVTRDTRRHLNAAVRLTIIGTAALLAAMVAVAYLVTSLVVSAPAAAAAAVVLLALGGYTWFYQPLVAFSQDHDRLAAGRHTTSSTD